MNYDVDIFFEKFSDDYDKFCEKYEIFNGVNDNITSNCEICIENASSMSFNGCRHSFCENCLETFLTIKINENMESCYIKCPAYQCNNLIEDELIHQLVPVNIYEKYQTRVLDEFIFNHLKFQNCPAPNCHLVIHLTESLSLSSVVCTCGRDFCFHCDFEISHYPLPCAVLKKWTQLLAHYGKAPASAQWIQNNSKPCPKCKRPIIKNEGCDHMHCVMCGHDYSWMQTKIHESDKPFFVESNLSQIELTINSKRRKVEEINKNIEFTDNKYDLSKIDTCSSKFISALACFQKESAVEILNYYQSTSVINAIRKCQKILIISSVLEFFLKDEKIVFLLFHEHELQQRIMALENSIRRKKKDDNFINEKLV